MEIDRMNYYFTGVLIVMMVLGFLWRTNYMIDKFIYNFFGKLDILCGWIDKLFETNVRRKRNEDK